MSIGLGLGALVFAFFLLFSDPQSGGQMMQQVQQTAASLTKPAPKAPEAGTALAPESRLDGFPLPGGGGASPPPMRMNAPALPSAASQSSDGNPNLSDAESYLDSAWGAGGGSQPAPQARQMPQQRRMPFGGGGFGQGGFSAQRMQQGFPQQGGPQGFPQQGGFNQMMNQGDANQSRLPAARGALEYELNQARSRAAQAAECMYRAQNAGNSSEKQSAASEARSHANAARAAASRAASQAGSIPELQSMVGQIRNFANQASNSANQASSAASGW